jgi:outer membrane receptor protein involved in Fe transport
VLLCTLLVLLLTATGRAGAADPMGSLVGTVVSAKETPVASVTVVILGTGRETVTDDEGRFQFAHLEPGVYSVEARSPAFTVERQEGVEVRAGAIAEIRLRLVAVQTPLDEIVVTPSRYSILREKPTSSMELGREEIAKLPHLFDDLYRAVSALPGTSGNDISGRFNVRGGLHHEVLVQLDGLELYEPFHLKDFQGPFTIIDPESLGGVDLDTGGFPAEYGDRMTGVLDMSTVNPTSLRTGFSISFTTTELWNAGTFANDRGSWLASLRRGYLDIVLNFVEGDNEFSPFYWDALGKVTLNQSSRSNLSLQLLWADDDFKFEEVDQWEEADLDTGYGSAYAWLRHQLTLGSSTVVDTVLSASRIDRNRRFFEDDTIEYPPEYMNLRDERVLDVLAVKQDWSHAPSRRHYLKWGFDLRSLEADYDYYNDYIINDVLAEYRHQPPVGTLAFLDSFTGEQYGVYAADRFRLGKNLTVELGARYDEQTLLDDSQVSPRVNMVYALGNASVVRLAWGRFHQSQRLYELQVEDGERAFHPAERAEHRIIGWEHGFGRGLTLSIDAYQREISDTRPRWECLFDPWAPFSELHPDRVLIAPQRSRAEGAEVFLRREGGSRVSWWVHYTWSSVEDEVDGRWQPRQIDQEHALVFDVNIRPRRNWNLNMAWRYHSGWPTTAISVELVETPGGSVEPRPVLGPYYAENVSGYHRLDLRASRTWQRKRGALSVFLEVQNLYNRENERGRDFDDSDIYYNSSSGQLELYADREDWLGMIPSLGLSWEF